MNLIDVLLFQDRRQLVKLLKENNSCNPNSKREMIEVLYPKLMNSNELFKKMQQLSCDAKRLLLALCYDQKQFLSKEELHGFLPKLKSNPFQLLLTELLDAGILFSYSGNNFLIPSQIKKKLLTLVHSSFEQSKFIVPTNNEQTKEIKIINDLFYIVDLVAERPLPLTKTGMLHKKDFQLLMTGFSVKEDLPNEKWRFGYGRRFSQYPDRFSMIYDYCIENNWLWEEAGFLKVGEGLDHLYNLKIDEFIKGILNYWLKLYRTPIPSIRFLYQLLFDVLNEGEAIEIDCLINELSPFVEDYYFDGKEEIIDKRFLSMLDHLNVIKKVKTADFYCYTLGPAHIYTKNC